MIFKISIYAAISFLSLTLISPSDHLTKAFAAESRKATKRNPPKKIDLAEEMEAPSGVNKSVPELMAALRERVKKYKWDLSYFSSPDFQSHGTSVNGMPLIYWTCGQKGAKNSSLVLSSVHGDEVTPVYFGFRLVEWVKARPELCKDRFIVIAPMVNPDGFLRYTSGTRTNFNKVDVNRNFETPEWNAKALKLWREKFNSQRRYYPGPKASSEPETQFQMWLIDEFQPQKILTVHAPLNMMDYDGPGDNESNMFSKKYVESCEELRSTITKATPELQFFAFGNFPGSLGNYAGKQRGIPTLTAELPTSESSVGPYYFGLLEKGTRLFFEYELKENPLRAQKRSNGISASLQ